MKTYILTYTEYFYIQSTFAVVDIYLKANDLSGIFLLSLTDVPSRIDQFCYSLVVDTANGQYLKHKYSRLSDLPQVCFSV